MKMNHRLINYTYNSVTFDGTNETMNHLLKLNSNTHFEMQHVVMNGYQYKNKIESFINTVDTV